MPKITQLVKSKTKMQIGHLIFESVLATLAHYCRQVIMMMVMVLKAVLVVPFPLKYGWSSSRMLDPSLREYINRFIQPIDLELLDNEN